MKKLVAIVVAALFLLTAGQAFAKELYIGVLSDLTGGTAAVGTPYGEGVMAAGKYLNSQGGVAGYTLKLDQVDYAYKVQQALSAYKKFKSNGMVALQGWGTGDTEALTKTVAKDKIPTFSASYSAHLTDPTKAPYNFFIAADYSTQARGALKYIKDNWKEKRAPRLALLYPDHPYGLSPIPAIKAYAKELGFDLVGEEVVGLRAMDATTQLLSLQKKKPDFAWIGGTTSSAAVIMKDAKKLKMDTVFVSNIWGADENIFKLAGDAANGNISLQTAVVWGTDVPGMKVMEKLTGGEAKMTHFIRGFASMLTMAEGIKLAAAKGKVTGPSIKAALETLKGYSPMGLTPPLTYTGTDHRPNLSVNIYKLQDGKMEFQDTVTLERRADWLGI